MEEILNLSCGNDSYGNHMLDKFHTKTTTIVYDMEEDILLDGNYFDKVYERSLLEHIGYVGTKALGRFLDYLSRLKSKIEVYAPKKGVENEIQYRI